MKSNYFLIIGLFISALVNAQIINFPDPAFKARLLAANSWNHVAENAAGISVVIDTNNDGNIQISEALLIVKMDVYNGGYIQSIVGVEYFTNLIFLNCSQNGIASINVSQLSGLKTLICDHNQALTLLNISGLFQLEELNVSQCSLTSLNLNGLSSIQKINCDLNNLTTLDLSSLTNLIEVNCNNNLLTSINTNGLPNLKMFGCSSNQLMSFDFTNLTALEELGISNNVNLSSINVSGMQTLKRLECNGCQLTTLALSGLPNLVYLNCGNNLFQTLNLSNLTSLTTLDCSFNQLTSLEFGNLNGLTSLECSVNQLSNLNIENMINMVNLRCSNNLLEQLDVSLFEQLNMLLCSSNQLQNLDCSRNPNLQFLECQYNQLEFLNIKNGNSVGCNFFGNPTLEYLCVDEEQSASLQLLVLISYQYTNMTNCVVGDYCSFTPGGRYYTIQGNQKIDSNINGCDGNDAIFPNLNMNITDGTISGNVISDTSGNYSIFVGQGIHTITPILENPTYFNISPTSIQVAFPDVISPNIQNFCITPNGIHNDLEVVIVPLIPARPGFDATYKIVYKNKGNTTMSGSVSFNFEDNKMDFVSSAPIYTIQSTNQLIYDYTNLAPFESREIIITININSPIETPAVNIGDQLNFTATINPITGDEFLSDNVSSLKQIVVGSYDPNDKTCIEGTIVGPSVIGQYVHYVIRFENTGTFAAENVVVKDMIDLNKFDLNTLIPISSSHAFVTRIASDGKVEFIFEGINLPFNDANNDGYVAIKIKTKSNLAVGDTFSNNASIFFDYNFPIVTNIATTTIQALGTNDFEFTTYFTLHPNPAKGVVTILAKKEVYISSLSIYNTLGQLILAEANPNSTIDISALKTGNYFIKIVSDKGMTTTKLLKH